MGFDLDAVTVETTNEPFTFRFGGQDFTLPPSIDIVAAASLEGGQLYEGLRRLLGAEQWDRLVAVEEILDQNRMVALMEAYGEHIGTTLGESQASTGSSKSTERPSKRTSNASTT